MQNDKQTTENSTVVFKIEFTVDSFDGLNQMRADDDRPELTDAQIIAGCNKAKQYLAENQPRIAEDFFEYVLDLCEEYIEDGAA